MNKTIVKLAVIKFIQLFIHTHTYTYQIIKFVLVLELPILGFLRSNLKIQQIKLNIRDVIPAPNIDQTQNYY